MPESNPYAPPQAEGNGGGAGPDWLLDGTGLLARHAAHLPEIDLVSGRSDGDLLRVARSPWFADWGRSGITMGLIFIVVYLNRWLDLGRSYPVWVAILVLLVLWLRRLRGGGTARSFVWTYREARYERRYARRQTIRAWLAVLVAIGLLGVSFGFWRVGGSHLWMPMVWVYGTGLGLLGVDACWRLLDRKKPIARAGPPGWLSFPAIHPDAYAALHALSQSRAETSTPESSGPRRVFTAYLYRAPLRALLGSPPRRWLVVVSLALMKLLRSRHLVRDFYHFSEAGRLDSPDALHPRLRNAVETWIGSHPDWRLLLIERIGVPRRGTVYDGLTIDSVYLVSPDLAHRLTMVHLCLRIGAEIQKVNCDLTTWMADGKQLATSNCEPLPWGRPHVETQFVSQPAEDLLNVHLARCQGRVTMPPATVDAALEALRRDQQELFEVLQKAGYYSAVREEI